MASTTVFGPVTAVIPYEGLEEAVDIANDTRYGLACSIYSRDEEKALQMARRIRSGGVAINCAGVSLTQPFGGYKQSGIGRESGRVAIEMYTELKSVCMMT